MVRRSLSIALLLGVALAQTPQTPQEPGLPAAAARMQAGDFAGAAAILEGVTKREPGNARAWRNLGVANHRLKKYDEAIAANAAAWKIDPQNAVTAYNLGCEYALKGDAGRAFEYLEKAKALKADLTNMVNDPDLVSVKGDPRFARLIPKPEDFANPFVEPVTILREWAGDVANGQFGWIARAIGDVDGDGLADVATSAPTAGGGRVFVYSSGKNKLLWKVDGQPGDQLGIGIEGAGDVDRDGVPDVVAAAPGAGIAYLYSGKDGRLLRTMTAENRRDAFGRHVSSAGDIDSDGFADVVIGAPANNAGGQGAGRAYVYSGRDGAVLLTLTGESAGDAFGSTVAGQTGRKNGLILVGAPRAGPRRTGRTYVYEGLSGKPRFTIDSDETGRALGAMFLSIPGDVDGDGVPDVYVSDFSNAAMGPGTGRAYVHSGKDGHRLHTFTGETVGEGFGIGVAGAGDVDRDGHDDLIIGAWQYGAVAASAGRAMLYSGRDGKVLQTYTCRVPGDTFGFDAVGIGDINRDGVTDLLLTSAWSGIHGYHSGRVFIISSGVRPAAK